MRSTIMSAAAAAALMLAGPAMAEPQAYVVDKSHAFVTFTVDHLGFSQVQGLFERFDAEVTLDPEAVETSSVRFVIDAASINTFWPKRDEHIRGGDFLEVETYPEIVFESTRITPTGGDTADVTGNLTIRDVTKEVTFEATLNKLGPSPFNPDQTIAGFTATGVIDRTAFGVSYAAPAVGAMIPVTISLEMSPAS